MSLKAFHLVFITAAILLAFGFGAWLLNGFFNGDGRALILISGIISVAAGVGLIGYEIVFLKKTKHISYL